MGKRTRPGRGPPWYDGFMKKNTPRANKDAKPARFGEHTRVRLCEARPEYSLVKGDTGTVVYRYADGSLEVEFGGGSLVAQVVTIEADALEVPPPLISKGDRDF